MTDRIHQLAHRLVGYMDQQNYVLQDNPNQSKPIPQDLLRAFRDAVYAASQDDQPKTVHQINPLPRNLVVVHQNQNLEDLVREYQQP